MVPYGLQMTDTEPQGNYPVIEIDEADVAKHKLTAGVSQLRFQRPSPVAVEDKKKGTILAASDPDNDVGFVAVAQADRGQVVVMGISLWWNWLASKDEAGADNARLLQNLLSKP